MFTKYQETDSGLVSVLEGDKLTLLYNTKTVYLLYISKRRHVGSKSSSNIQRVLGAKDLLTLCTDVLWRRKMKKCHL
jgi:hypothetical protein